MGFLNIMRDIQNKKPLILNLSYYRQRRLPLTQILKSTIILVVITFFLFSFVYAPVHNSPSLIFAAQNNQTNEERQKLENQLAELEKQISDYENAITQYQKQGQSLKNEIKTLESKISKLNLQTKAVNINLENLNQEIGTTQSKIASAEQNIGFNKEALSQVLQNLYENESQSLMEIFVTNPNLSDFFGNINNLMLVQDNLRITVDKIIQLKNDLLDQKEQLALEKTDAETLKAYRVSQKQTIQETQVQKNAILKITKGKESEYQKLVAETKKTAAEIRKQIFKMLGGGELNFEKAYELAKFAEQATGVPAAFILAVLDRESALGANVGQCDYKTAMHPRRDIPVFLNIIQELNLKNNLEAGIIKVSCANSDGAYGGAMGPAQFIPSTWVLYKNSVADITGNNPPSPWNNEDAFVATALYLKNALNSCSNYSGLAQERCAAARYYGGSRWRNYLWTYGDRVITQAQSFQNDIDVLIAS